MAALWTARHIVSIPQGACYSGGTCTIQIGELRSIREGPQSGATQSPGVVICITVVVGNDEPEDSNGTETTNGITAAFGEEQPDFEYAQAVIRDCWNKIREGRDLGRSEIKEVMMLPSLMKGKEREREGAVRMWCDVLRLRG